MSDLSYPALYTEADAASDRTQALYMNLIKGEYVSLLIAAVFALDIFSSPAYYVVYGLVFLIPFSLLLARAFLKPEQGWYQARALAESVKTLTWKYVMRAAPFEGAENIEVPRANFRNYLRSLLTSNRYVGNQFPAVAADGDQITDQMDEIRGWDLNLRRAFYLAHRVDDQRRWYAKKAAANRRWARRTIVILIVLYGFAAVMVLSRVALPTWRLDHPEPLIVAATSLIGWMQIKKFNELGTSYTLTAHEIGLIHADAIDVKTDEEMSRFVDAAEQAFSREHTQ